MPDFKGQFQIDARSHIFGRALLDGEYEPELVRLCAELVDPHRDAVDVGANVGLFSVLLAHHLPERRVLAIEPSPAVVARLQANLVRNGVADRVPVFVGAASDQPGQVELSGIPGKEEYGTIGRPAHPGIWADAPDRGARIQSVSVMSQPLDALVEEHGLTPGFIKVDVEGAENLVISGARQTLQQHRPIVLSELSDRLLRANGTTAMEVVQIFLQLDYRVLDPLSPGRPNVTRAELEKPHGVEEILCIPAEHRLA